MAFKRVEGEAMRAKTIVAITVLVVLISACVGQSNPYQMEIGSQKVTFRANLDKAKDVPLSPSDGSLKSLLLDLAVDKIILAYVPDSAYNGFYSVSGYDITYKMVLIQNLYYGDSPQIEAVALNTTEEAYRLASPATPVILLKAGAEKTAVTVDKNVVLVEGKDMTESGRDYTDLDLAADRLILELLKV